MISNTVKQLINLVDDVNKLMAELHANNVEVRINYRETLEGKPPQIDLWRVVEHIDHLKRNTL